MGSRILSSQSQRQSHWQSLSLARSLGRVLAGAAVSIALTLAPQGAMARQAPDDVQGVVGTIAAQQLPNEARQTLERIEAGGPFPYDKDGSRFGNYERSLPQQSRGYYREYTVKNSNSRNRGAKRIVCGGDQRAANDCYYTEDHYNSFKRITK
ncbi:ribonuclease T1 [Cupriavidus metallidurans]